MIKRPMLAATVKDVESLKYPLLASGKVDGIRILHHPELGPVTRKFKPIPNKLLQEWFRLAVPVGLDGEFVLTGGSFNDIQSFVMSHHGDPLGEPQFWVFDCFLSPSRPYRDRLTEAYNLVDEQADRSRVTVLPHLLVHNAADLNSVEVSCHAQGYEGVMLRDLAGPYKEGRSTLNQGWLLKLKRFVTAEGTITGFEARKHHVGDPILDELGYQKRLRRVSDMVELDMLGALQLNTPWGVLSVGSGLNDIQRQEIWDNKEEYLGRLVTFKYQPHGVKNRPRFPIFIGFRPEME